ncbi:MAG TPA: DUF4097 family beta strand repeat-containing protein [Bacillota bacterium]|nr:DUF4097 family beta strand repeat-containing protein [Bacillota bacterium]
MRHLRIWISIICISCGVVGIFFTLSNYLETTNVKHEYKVEHDRIDTIFIKDHVASIEVTPSNDAHITVSWEENENRSDNHVTIDEQGNQLIIKRQKRSFFIPIPTLRVQKQHMKIHVPEHQLKALDIQNSVGSVSVQDIHVDDLKIQTDVQKVAVSGVQAQNIQASSSVGAVEVNDSAGDMSISSNVGSVSVDISEVTGNMDLLSDVGSVKLTVDEQPGNVSFHGSSNVGSVRIFGDHPSIRVPNATYEVYVKTDVGKVEVRSRNR